METVKTTMQQPAMNTLKHLDSTGSNLDAHPRIRCIAPNHPVGTVSYRWSPLPGI